MKFRFLFLVLAALLAPLSAWGNFADLVAQGDEYDRKLQNDRALEFYLPAEKLSPNDPVLLVKIARQHALRMAGLPKVADKIASGRTALRYAERAVALAPNDCDPHLSVAICWGKLSPYLGNQEKVAASRKIKDSANRAVKLDPKNDYAWHLLGRWHQALANMGTTTRTLARLIYGELPAASNEEAVACFKKALAIQPKRLIHSIELGRTYAMMGREEDARKWIRQGLAMPNKEKDDPETKQRGQATLNSI
jgi:tetratricopeptide (TPR) repeat protein